jgi:hypothetical protein
LRLLFAHILFFLLCLSLKAQFYNGHQMSFGKNRVQYQDFYWSYVRYEKFDTYFNQFGKLLAENIADIVNEELYDIEEFFDYDLESRLIFIVFNNLSEFRQSNIGLVTGKEDSNIGGVAQISKNKVFVYFDGNNIELRKQVRKAIAQVVLNEMLYGSLFVENIANSALLKVPEWYNSGLLSYISEEWSIEVENRVKDGLMNGKYEKIGRLYADDAMYAGHSLWHYIAKTYGEALIPNIIYLTRINKRFSDGFLYSLGLSLKELTSDWTNYYISQFSDYPDDLTLPEGNLIKKKSKVNVKYSNLKINPRGEYITWVSNEMGRYKVWLLNETTGKRKVLLRGGNKIEQIVDETFPILNWHPTGRFLSIMTEEEGGIKLYFYTIEEKELTVRNFLYFEKVNSFSYSPDGKQLVLSAVKNGKSDIFVHTLASGTNQQITNDIADDLTPQFIHNGEDIVFSSNRVTNSVQFEESNKKALPTFDLFVYRFSKADDQLIRFENFSFANEYAPIGIDNNKLLTLSDASGIMNVYEADFDSTIAYIDTIVHYRYFANYYPRGNYAYNVQEFDYNKLNREIAEVMFYDGRYWLYKRSDDGLKTKNTFETPFRKLLNKKLAQKDSVENIQKEVIPINEIVDNTIITATDTFVLDEGFVDINAYIFEREKVNYYNNKLSRVNLDITFDTAQTENKVRIYQPTFYVNSTASQINFSYLNESYQVYSGTDPFQNSPINLLQKVGINDLFEDYKLIAGIGVSPPSLQDIEFLISLENLKGRTDKQYIYHRQKLSFNASGGEPVQTIGNNFFYIRRYALSQVAGLSLTGSLRHSNVVFLPSDAESLIKKNQHRAFAGVKAAFIFDNTRSLGINLHDGIRFKVFAEAMKQINTPFDDLYVLGGDFRVYTRLHRNLILANRFAASSSFGSAPLVYFLGGVDGWMNINGLFPRYEGFQQFIPVNEIPVDPYKNYAFRSLATNMRGFQQNIRNGNNFFVLNNEIRFPFVSYIANYPLSSNFLNSLQVVGFFDVGSAWTGLNPYSGQNPYDTQTIESADVTLILDTNRDPIIYGYGFGFRSQLLGYFVRLDFSWGVENNIILPMLFYLSFNLDF